MGEAGARTRTGGLFYGWVVVGGAFVVLLVGFGMAYAFGAFFSALQAQFDASRSEVSLVFAITACLYFGLGAVSGPLADRFGPSRVIVAGIVLIALGLFPASRAQTLWQVYLTYGLGVGLGVGFAYVPAIGVVQRWFLRRRGLASGVAVSGIGVGTLLIPPFAAWLLSVGDWRTAYAILAAVTLSLGVAGGLVIEHSPQRRGLAADGAAERPGTGEGGSSAPARGHAVRDAIRSRPFLLLYLALLAAAPGLFMPFAHLVSYARDHGLSAETGALLVGLIGVGSTVGRFLLGGVADQLGRRRALAGTTAGISAMLVWWLFATSAPALAVFAVLFGVFYGGLVALNPALTADYFGGRNAGGIIGLLYTGVSLGALLGPTLAGLAYDVQQSYTLPVALAAAINLLGVLCLCLAPEPAAWRERAR